MTTKEFVDNFKLKEKTMRRDSRGSVGINECRISNIALEHDEIFVI